MDLDGLGGGETGNGEPWWGYEGEDYDDDLVETEENGGEQMKG